MYSCIKTCTMIMAFEIDRKPKIISHVKDTLATLISGNFAFQISASYIFFDVSFRIFKNWSSSW